jgi:hypothetical protein
MAVVASLPVLSHKTAAASALGGAVAKGSGAVKPFLAGGISGAVLGPIVGVLGAIYGTMASIANTRSKRERRFMLKAFCLTLPLVGVFIFGLFKIVRYIHDNNPSIKTSIALIAGFSLVYIIALMLLIIWINRRQRRIQIEDGTYIDPWKQGTSMQGWKAPPVTIISSYTVSIFGGMIWLLVFSLLSTDWLTFCITFVFTVGLCVQATIRAIRAPQRYFPIIIQSIVIMAIFTLIVFNLRWEYWVYEIQSRLNERPLIGFGKYPGQWGFNAIIIAIYLFIWQRLAWVHRKTHKAK